MTKKELEKKIAEEAENRRWHIKYWIFECFDAAKRMVRTGNRSCMETYLDQAGGMALYMKSVGDIGEKQFDKILKIVSKIRRTFSEREYKALAEKYGFEAVL